MPVSAVLLTGGERNDITQAPALLAGFKPKYVLADKGYDSRDLVALIRSHDAQTVIPPRNCQQPRPYDKASNRLRNRIEGWLAKLEQFAGSPLASTASPATSSPSSNLASISIWVD